MMKQPEKILMIIIIGLLLIGTVIMLLTFFGTRKDSDSWKDLIEAKDETIKVLQDQRPMFERYIEQLNRVVEERKRYDSILIVQINLTKQSIKQVDDKLKNIPVRISRIANNNDSIRAAFADY